MGSVYAQPSSSGGSVYAQGGTSPVAPKQKGGGGILGSIEHVGHVIASKASKAGHDIESFPGGALQTAHFAASPFVAAYDRATGHGGAADKQIAFAHQYEHGTVAQVKHTIAHPGDDPFQTLLLALPAVHGAGRLAEPLAGVDRALPRALRQGDATVGMPPRSKNGTVAIGQHVYDKTLQKALDKNQAGEAGGRVSSRLAAHAEKRIGGQIKEAERPRQAMRRIEADDLESAGRHLRGRLGNHPVKNQKIAQLALDLTSKNLTAREAQVYHMGQVAKGIAPKANLKLAKLYRQMDEQELLVQDEHGNVTVNAEKFPRLAQADEKLATAQESGGKIVKDYGLMSEKGAQARIDLPGQIVRASLPEGERARPMYAGGRGYTSQKVLEKRAPTSPIARAANTVIGEPKSPIGGKQFKGEAAAQGKVPTNTTHLAAQHLRDLVRYVNTAETRKRWAESGSDTRRSPRDILVKKQGESAKPLPPEYEAMLGRGKLTTGEDEAQQASLREYLNHLVPGLRDDRIRRWEKDHDIGAPAPPGYRWVSENTVGDLKSAFAASRGKPGRAFDNVNSAITAQTVYYKIGHVGTRALTNAALNLTEGSLKGSGQSFRLWKQLTERDRLRAYAAAGQHGFHAMPHEGVGRIGRVATRGANFWAHRFDSPFRFNSIAYQAAKAGYKTPAQFRSFLDKLEHPEKLDPLERVKVENVAKLTNRENISYDRLNDRERRFLARGLWFYPWVKGSSAWTVRAMLEHPLKAGLAGQAMQQGRAQQAKVLGDLPSYEFGLTPFGHGKVTNLNTFNPAGTLAGLLQIPEYTSAAENLNPAAAFIDHLLHRTNQYGEHSNKPLIDAINSALSPTPEFQIASAATGKRSKMFPSNHSTLDAFLRMLVGPAMPRNVDTAILHSTAARERSGR